MSIARSNVKQFIRSSPTSLGKWVKGGSKVGNCMRAVAERRMLRPGRSCRGEGWRRLGLRITCGAEHSRVKGREEEVKEWEKEEKQCTGR